ncbi:hypothetical protein DLM45_08980 [Hyphomicrobium methylovorum]|uniref:hypothetical protein n=1 Tax=Hyphomicrobium methylovorum TaxID=84 RepID=UPI0015E756C0|nr:hypothetical protein [Hyphomicrobium methylovorum]MBA2126356.1 hypothetical protein [Hyphomicrobium methylovorum]
MRSVFVALGFAVAALSFAMPATEANANGAHKTYKAHPARKAHVAKRHHYRFPARPRHTRYGYGRPGPRYGYGFGFMTYKGDPFYRDDYYDGRGCHYLHRQDFCRGRKSLDWLRFH